MKGRPNRLLTLAQIATIQKRRARGEKYEVLISDFNTTKQMIWYFTKGPGRIKRGICRYCFCTETTACAIPTGLATAVACHWIDEAKTVCSAERCQAAHQRNLQRLESN